MMDPAADDLLIASIGRSPRNDPEPPGPHYADQHGRPLDNATVPASTEARTRHVEPVNMDDHILSYPRSRRGVG